MKILVTGANGFVGGAIVQEFLDNDFDQTEIFCVGGLRSKIPKFPNYFAVDITKEENLAELLKISKIDTFIHSAGLAHQFADTPPEKFWEINAKGTENAVSLAARLNTRHFILISSVSVYGSKKQKENQRGGITENEICEPEGVYAQSKLEAERIAERICRENKIALTVLRLATVIGEGDGGNVLRLIRMIDKRRFVWIGKGKNQKSLIYKADAARACRIIACKKKGNEREVFNLSAAPVTVKEIVELIAENLERNIPKIFISSGLLLKSLQFSSRILNSRKIEKLSETIYKWVSNEAFSADKIKREYGFETQTSIAEALKREVGWYRSL
ncbi:MAG TPA: NAD(P)-dependent oxidoreductase [Pyrinomonadaceae bacterium]|nr:NAD(P)-dependent oxidoreductase [Pyrinomonadaceae bacterium]